MKIPIGVIPIRIQYSLHRETIFFCSHSGQTTLAVIHFRSALELALSFKQLGLA
jgi:hypothetical protein